MFDLLLRYLGAGRIRHEEDVTARLGKALIDSSILTDRSPREMLRVRDANPRIGPDLITGHKGIGTDPEAGLIPRCGERTNRGPCSPAWIDRVIELNPELTGYRQIRRRWRR